MCPVMTDEEQTYRNDHRLNSRPLDVHRWSDHPEVKQLIDLLWGVFTEKTVLNIHLIYN
jgi:hypothetical protein